MSRRVIKALSRRAQDEGWTDVVLIGIKPDDGEAALLTELPNNAVEALLRAVLRKMETGSGGIYANED